MGNCCYITNFSRDVKVWEEGGQKKAPHQEGCRAFLTTLQLEAVSQVRDKDIRILG
jgi:hypothetical protein